MSIESYYSDSDNWSDRWQNADWMSRLNEKTKLSDLSIPGTHDSAAKNVAGIAKTQSLDIPTQLINGIRYLDIRVRVTNGVFACHHGPYFLNIMFGDVLQQCHDFLYAHPNETIYMRLKQEKSSVSDEEFNSILNNRYINTSRDWFYFGNSNPTIGETKNKIVIFRNFLGNDVGISYPGDLDIQDDYNASTTDDKNHKVEKQLLNSNAHYGNGITYINYLSFFTYSSSNKAKAKDVNYWTVRRFCTKVIQHAGIIVADYPGDQLINRVIDMNRKNLKEPDKYYDNAYVVIRSQLDQEKVVDWSQSDLTSALVSSYGHGYNQRWVFKYNQFYNAYEIVSEMDQTYSLVANGQPVIVSSGYHGKPEALWRLEITPYNSFFGYLYKIKNIANNNYFDVCSSKITPYGELITYPHTGNDNQLFVLNQD